MSVQVRDLTRFFGSQAAVDGITFQVGRGELVGFLGPNGAGKSTTMKMLTGYLQASSGSAWVNGFDVEVQSLDARRSIGYLPEHNPLYLEMYVHEFLHYSGSLYGMRGSVLRSRIGEMISVCGLVKEQNKKIEALSRGYRQRVGLAQALLHDPPVLILDEPTSGLDPNQLDEIRALIRTVSRDKTVLLSTHIMQEVQAICDRVVIIHNGRLVADESLSSLLEGTVQVLEAEFGSPVSPEAFGLPEGAAAVEAVAPNRLRIRAGAGDIRETVFKHAAERQLPLVGLSLVSRSLEDRFRELTRSGTSETIGA